MYRNAVYLNRSNAIRLFTWDKDGNRIFKDFHYKPYLYVETGLKDFDKKSIFGTNLKKCTFKNTYERRNFENDCGKKRIFGGLPPTQQFLIDTFYKVNKKPKFGENKLKICSVDIEVYCPEGFPDEWDADYPINVISYYDNLKKTFFVFGLEHDFEPSKLRGENLDAYVNLTEHHKVHYEKFKSEEDLLRAFVIHWSEDHPDVITGWNISFDIPYIINRCKKYFDERFVNKLSPVGNIWEKFRKKKLKAQYEKTIRDYVIDGVSNLDYFEVYAKFNHTPVPDMKLDTIAQVEGVGQKVDFESSNLASLADNDWNLFVWYNIVDVNIIRLLELKLKFLEISRMLAYMGLTTFDNALSTIPIVNGYAAINALHRDQITLTADNNKKWRKYPGAFVKVPVQNSVKEFVSYDLNSLYPNTMITLNMSPETKVGRIISGDLFVNNEVFVEVDNSQYKVKSEIFKDFLVKNKFGLSKSGVIFDQKKQGIFSEMVEEVYNGRVSDKNEIKRLKKSLTDKSNKEEIETKINQFDILQYAKKIFINSVYGYCGNQYAGMSDIEIAESVTLTCQEVIKKSDVILNDLLITRFGLPEADYCNYCDTDSTYLRIDDLLKKLNLNIYNEDHEDKIIQVCNTIETILNDGIKKWGETELFSIDSRFEFKREAIADYGLFLQKKHYIYHCLNNEGFKIEDEDKRWKYKGIRLVSSTMPKQLKPLVEQVVRELVKTNDQSYVNSLYMDSYDEFKKLKIEDVAINKSVNKLSEYINKSNGWTTAKGMDASYRGAYYYNMLLDILNISDKYQKIRDGDKAKMVYLERNNKYNIDVIAYLDQYPKEFEELFTMDIQVMFGKQIKDVIDKFYESVGWKIRSPNMQFETDIMSLFGKKA